MNSGPKRNPLREPQQANANKTGGKMPVQPPTEEQQNM